MARQDPILNLASIMELRPTQITVGMREVADRRRRWKERHGKKPGAYLGTHMIPVVRGPKDRNYIVDHHHLALALHEERVKDVLVSVVADLRALDQESFWFTMDNRGWMHPFDKNGKRRPYKDLPKTVSGLLDDPFRSLAGELRRMGGFAKDTTPFSEFLWADFLRRRIKPRKVEENFDHALETAMKLARSSEAEYLPGWCGPTMEE